MRIFITGVAGFLGSHLADAMIKEGHEVVGVDNLIGGYLDNVPEDVEYYQVDCKYLNTMNKLMKGVDIVYHTACTAYEGLSVFSPELVCQNTYQITAAVASAAVSQGVKRFVYCSSMARYGTQEVVPFTEDMIPKPQDPYGISKLAAEHLISCLGEVHGMEYVIAVPHNIIGPRQKYDDPYRNVASIMINLMLQGRQPIIYGDGTQKRCFSFVQDDIECLKKLAFQEGLNGEIVNIGPDEEFVKLREAIIPIQVGMMEEFAKEYPKMAQNARVIHTKDDSILFTSYETYLRGELTTYSFSTLVLYGRFLAGLAKEGKNLAKIIMTKSAHLYGYDTLEKAENSI